MSNNVLGIVVAFAVGLIVGLLIAWFYLRQRIREHETNAHSLQISLNEKEGRLQNLQTRLREREASLEQLRGQASQKEESIRDLAAQLEERDSQIMKMKPHEPDNLRRIEGIGPKISSVLQAAGITTFAQLAATDVSRLKQIITEAGLAALADPSTWPEQAGLAAAGKWDALGVLQDELKGGRRM
ncbi:MAG: DUF4332 domain-containing protein [Chloroflexota bacterium]|nr:DUF4332 domain-containing protein [Chloroflexota bacterium]